MAGLIGTGIDYRNKALSSIMDQASLEQDVRMQNEQWDAQGKAQKSKIGGELSSLGMIGGYAAGGPAGAAGGGGLGFLFSKLF